MSTPKQILIISSWYPTPDRPFLGNFVQRQASLLARTYQVTVIYAYPAKEAGRIIKKEGDYMELTRSYEHGKNSIKNYLNRRRAYQMLLDEVSTPDFIIGMVAIPIGSEFLRAKKKFGCKLVYFEHGSFYNPEGHYKWDFRKIRMRSRLGQSADRIIAVSEVLKNDMQPYFPSRAIEVVPNHVDEKIFTFQAKRKGAVTHFLHISTLDPKTKNPQGILEACRLLKERGFSFHLTIISDEDVSAVREATVAFGLTTEIDLIGPLAWETLPSYYHRSDAFLLFSPYETFSIVIAEAIMTGTLVIAPKTGIMNDNCGIVLKKYSTPDLAEAMQQVIEGKDAVSTEAMRRYANGFSSEEVLKRWKEIIPTS